MTPERWQQVDRLFAEALERVPQERASFLDHACGDDRWLREKLEALIGSHEVARSFLDSPPMADAVHAGAGAMIGDTIGGCYRITAKIGAGGMGEVYRATDTRLRREVALKFSAEKFSQRFEREARAVAALNHPNVCTLYDVGPNYLVMELVEGPTLAERIAQGPIGLDDALGIARQIAAALEAAHDANIVHRDLKPGNVKIKPDGTVKVLDFGLAKMGGPAAILSDDSPTISMASTQEGVILGTAAYMSPEQARGKTVDKHADIWAFGVVLFEMLTGRRLFGRADLSETLASVIKEEPDWNRVPAKVRRLLRRCLQKDPKTRLHDIRDLELLLEEAPAGALPKRKAWIVAAASIVITALAIPTLRHLSERPLSEVRLEIVTPSTAAPLDFALSPDGRTIAFVASGGGAPRLWLRNLDNAEAQVVVGTDGASLPFWSPDSGSIGFFAAGKLYRVDVTGGTPTAIAEASVPRGGAWNAEGTIVFAATPFTPLLRIPASGGKAVAVTRIDPPRQTGHHFPQFLPDGRRFIYYVQGSAETAGIYVTSLDGGEPKFLTAADSATFLPPDIVLFERQSTLLAQHLDIKRKELTGEPTRVAAPVGSDRMASGHAGFSVSADGRIAYRRIAADMRQLTWYDRSGKAIELVGEPKQALAFPELSRDGRRLAFNLPNGQIFPDIWLMDLVHGGLTRFTFDPEIDAVPVWSPDGTQIVFLSNRKGIANLYLKASNQTSEEQLLLETPAGKSPQDWSPDGRFLLFSSGEPRDLLVLPMSGNERAPIPVANTPFDENNGQFSPDGRWVAYETNESGNRFEIVVQPFPQPGVKWQVSRNGGTQPRWSHDGKEIYFIAPDGKLMATPVTAGGTFSAGPPAPLFQASLGPRFGTGKQQYAVSKEGRFLMNQPVEAGAATPITLILNWRPNQTK